MVADPGFLTTIGKCLRFFIIACFKLFFNRCINWQAKGKGRAALFVAAYLDGAAMLDSSGAPVVGLTLRHDRLDNFWFTLCHELAHVALHLGSDDRQCFFVDLDFAEEGLEKDADKFAGEALIPENVWKNASKLG